MVRAELCLWCVGWRSCGRRTLVAHTEYIIFRCRDIFGVHASKLSSKQQPLSREGGDEAARQASSRAAKKPALAFFS